MTSDGQARPDEYTINEAIEAQGFGRFHYWMLLLCGLCWMADAAELMLLSFLGPVLERDPAWLLAPHQVALIAGVCICSV